MKNLPLFAQIWLVFVAVTLFLAGVLVLFLPWTLEEFFTRQVFQILADSQKNTTIIQLEPVKTMAVSVSSSEAAYPPASLNADNAAGLSVSVVPDKTPSDSDVAIVTQPAAPNGLVFSYTPLAGQRTVAVAASPLMTMAAGQPVVNHLILFGKEGTLSPSALPVSFIEEIKADAFDQTAAFKEYTKRIGDRALLYVIKKVSLDDSPAYMISYAWSEYRNTLVSSMYWQLLALTALLILFSWLPSLALARHLSKPLTEIEHHAARLADGDWQHPLCLDRKDEIGHLAKAFEQMRQRLVRQDEAQRTFLQNVSHELKTPVMVIRSYGQSILDGIYPKENLEGSLLVINQEANRLEKRIKQFLYLNKLNYFQLREITRAPFDLSALVAECAERFHGVRPELKWAIELEPIEVDGIREQMMVALENILENQIRYAGKEIRIKLSLGEQTALLQIFNDGPPIDEQDLTRLFEPYYTGNGGSFGLGLAIAKQVCDLNGAHIWVNNAPDGVLFALEIPFAGK